MKPSAYQNLIENLEADFRDLSQFDPKIFEPRICADFEETKTWKIATAKSARLEQTKTFAKNQNPDLQDSKRQFENQLYFEKGNLKI